MSTTTRFRIDLQHPDQEPVGQIAQMISRGGVALLPTDTIYGFSCLAFQPPILQRILAIKGRDEGKGLLVLIPDLSWLSQVAREPSATVRKLLEQIWPGPVTILFPPNEQLAAPLVGASGKIGVRIPDLPFLQQVLERVGQPLVSTSANRSGEAYDGDLGKLEAFFLQQVDVFVESQSESDRAVASSVLDLTGTKPRILREGAEAARLRSFLNL